MHMVLRNPGRLLGLAMVALLLVACADGEVQIPRSTSAQTASFKIVDVTAETIPSSAHSAALKGGTTLPLGLAGEYRIGIGDIISVFVFDHPELTVPMAEGEHSGGFLVQSDGTISYPYIGALNARGRTVGEVRKEITERLNEFIPSPQVDVRVASFNSQRVVVGGEVGSPTTLSITTWPLTLLEAINAAGGLTEDADATKVAVRRGGESYVVNLDSFLRANAESSNPILYGGDVVAVPHKRSEEVYVLGEVGEPAAVDVSEEQISLTQALARQGGLDETRASASGVFVFREVDGQTVVYSIALTSPMGFVLGTRFILAPNDVVYVTRSPLQRWNDTISRVLPTLKVTGIGSE